MHNHNQFILSPITDILKDVVSASAGIGSGIETFPLCDYVMQSAFLKMTGSQEQKMKCICWEMATNDFEYRYHFTKMPLSECSTFKDKQAIYKDLIKQIKTHNSDFNLSTEINKAEILATTTSELRSKFLNTNLSIWAQKSFNEFNIIWGSIIVSYFANDDNTLFAAGTNDNSLKRIYEEHLYKRRNKIAHNTQSYQQNLPTLKTLLGENIKYENYFVYFGVLILIDKIFIELYKKYLVIVEEY